MACGCSHQPTGLNDYCDEHRREIRVTFTSSECDHLLMLLSDAETEGSYYGNREQYWKRHARIVEKLK